MQNLGAFPYFPLFKKVFEMLSFKRRSNKMALKDSEL